MLKRSSLVPLALALLAAAGPRTSRAATGETRVRIGLSKIQSDATVVSFGLPLAPDSLQDPAKLQVLAYPSKAPVSGVKTRALLRYYDKAGKPASVRSVLVQFPAAEMTGANMTIDVIVNAAAAAAGSANEPYSSASFSSSETVETADRRIVKSGDTYSLVETNVQKKTLYTSAEPKVLATYPDGYLAATGILGEQMSRSELLSKQRLQGLRYLSDNLDLFAKSMIYLDGYRLNPAGVYDYQTEYEGWLYDRAATYLTAYVHFNDSRYLRYAFRASSYYASHIGTSGDRLGIFTGKPDPDLKYSHQRGIFAYYALTGDEAAYTAGSNIASMWYGEPSFVAPYRQGHARGPDKLWTERLLATSIEGLAYGFAFTGDAKYRSAAQEIFNTAYRHATTSSQTELNAITVATVSFPPQNCFIHSALQHDEGNAEQPWCSSWMSELIIDPLRAYLEIEGDSRVDELFVRLGRFMRDVGANYFRGDTLRTTTFTSPKTACFDPTDTENPRILVPPYGSGVDAKGAVQNYGDYDDFEHSADASALMASAIRSLVLQDKWNNPYSVGPFRTEGQSFVALFHEFSAGASYAFANHRRKRRDPRVWKSSELAEGYSGGAAAAQQKWLLDNKIGFPVYETSPLRKLSWWFNTSMLVFKMLDSTGIDFSDLEMGFVQGQGCPTPATRLPPTAVTRGTESSTRHFPLFTVGGGFNTGLAVINLSGRTANLTFRAYDDAGGILGSASRQLAARGQLALEVGELLPALKGASGWLEMESDVPEVEGFSLVYDPAVTEMDAMPAAPLTFREFLFPVLDGADISIANPSAGSVECTLEYISAGGVVIDSVRKTVAANGRAAISSASLPAGAAGGWLHVSSNGGLAAVETFAASDWLGALPALEDTGPSAKATTLYAPQYVVGGGYATTLELINLERSSVTVSLRLFGDDAQPKGRPYEITLPARGAARVSGVEVFGLAPAQGIVSGYVTADSVDGRFTGDVRFTGEGGKVFGSALGLVEQGARAMYFSQVAQNAQYWTGLAGINTADQEATVEVTVYDAAGNRVASGLQAVPARGRFSKLLPDLVGALPEMSRGYFEVRSTERLASFALFGTTAGYVLAAIPPQIVAETLPSGGTSASIAR